VTGADSDAPTVTLAGGSVEADRTASEPLLEAGNHRSPLVEFLFFDGCPNHRAALAQLRHLLVSQGIRAPVRPVEITTDQDAQRERFLGSPSVRVDGRDVDPAADARKDYGLQCRLYATEDGLTGTPPDGWILRALNA